MRISKVSSILMRTVRVATASEPSGETMIGRAAKTHHSPNSMPNEVIETLKRGPQSLKSTDVMGYRACLSCEMQASSIKESSESMEKESKVASEIPKRARSRTETKRNSQSWCSSRTSTAFTNNGQETH